MFGFRFFFFFLSRRRHTRSKRDWSSDVCSSDLILLHLRLLTGVSAVLLSERRTCFEAAPRTDKRSGDREGIYRSLGIRGDQREVLQILIRSEERRVGKEYRALMCLILLRIKLCL